VRTTLSIVALTLFIGTAAAAPSPVEARKIEHLIAAVEQLSGAKFIRNGTAQLLSGKPTRSCSTTADASRARRS